MDDLLSRSWWMLALHGIAALLFGVLAWIWPGITMFWLVVFFAAYALVVGVSSVVAAINNRKTANDWWLLLLLGLAAIGAAVITVLYPALTALVLVLLIGANALVTGALQIALGIRLRKTIRNEWLLILTGVISIAFGVLVCLFPGAGALAMVWLIGSYATFTGVLLLVLAFRVRASTKGKRMERTGNLSLGGS
jgi:uncharacterized membrane protein HdeD (DUF308 family)